MNVRIRPGGIALFILALAALVYRLLYTLFWEQENDKGPLLSLLGKRTAVIAPTTTVKAPAGTARTTIGMATTPFPTPTPPATAPDLVPQTAKVLKDWLVLGPVAEPSRTPTDDLEQMTNLLETEHLPGQSRLQPQMGDTVTVRGARLKWVSIKTARLNLIGASKQSGGMPEAESFAEVAGYAVATVEVPTAIEGATLYLGSDDGVTVWLNGKRIHHVVKKRALKPGEDRVDGISLTAGRNTLVFKVAQGTGTWELAAALDLP